MKLLYILENYYPHVGGVETLFQSLAENMAKDNQVVVLTSHLPKTKIKENLNGVIIYRLKTPPFLKRYFFTFLAIPKAIQLARSADLIHTTTYNAAIPAWIAGKLARTKTIITVHEVLGSLWFRLPMSKIAQIFHWLFEQIVIRLPFNHYIAVSNYTKNCLISWFGIDEKKITRIYNGIDYNFWNPHNFPKNTKRKELGLSKKDFVYMYFGRPGWVKGVGDLVKAVPAISRQIPNSKLLLLLSTEPKTRYNAILKLIDKLNIKDKVIIHHSVPKKELPFYIRSANVVVIPSLSEGFGYSAVEAQALEVPVIARNVGSLLEVVGKQHCFDNLSQLTKLLQQTLNNKYTLHSQTFPLKKTLLEYKKIYTA